MLGGERVPVTGRQGPLRTSTDIDSPYPIWVDVKSRKQCPVSLWKWYRNVSDNAPPGKIPIVVLHRPHMEYNDSLVVMSIRDFIRIMEEAYGKCHHAAPSGGPTDS
jgi:hypothetical protein